MVWQWVRSGRSVWMNRIGFRGIHDKTGKLWFCRSGYRHVDGALAAVLPYYFKPGVLEIRISCNDIDLLLVFQRNDRLRWKRLFALRGVILLAGHYEGRGSSTKVKPTCN